MRPFRMARGWLLSSLIRGIGEFRRGGRDSLFVFYDLDLYPISFDFAYFLVWADEERRRRGLERMHVAFVPMADELARPLPPGYDQVVDLESRRWRFHNIVEPLARLVPSCAGVTVCGDRDRAAALALSVRHRCPTVDLSPLCPVDLGEVYRDIISELRLVSADLGLRAPRQAVRYIGKWIDHHAGGRELVVITLRQYGVDPARNSNLEAWGDFARRLDRNRFLPVVVPDTDHAFDRPPPELRDLVLYDPPAWNLELRMALYEAAHLNMLVSCGPATLCVLSPVARYLMFKISVPGVHLASEQILKRLGFVPGETPPFATPFQKWIWDRDDLATIEAEFVGMSRRIDAGALEARAAGSTEGDLERWA
ncbi:MAG: hypothetical protein V3T14_09670 [Myxococcota bacterium]